ARRPESWSARPTVANEGVWSQSKQRDTLPGLKVLPVLPEGRSRRERNCPQEANQTQPGNLGRFRRVDPGRLRRNRIAPVAAHDSGGRALRLPPGVGGEARSWRALLLPRIT